MRNFIIELIVFAVLLYLIGRKAIPWLNAAMTKQQEQIRVSLEAADQALVDVIEDARDRCADGAHGSLYRLRTVLAGAQVPPLRGTVKRR